ncbi:MAG TPA: 3D domain-containing protein [Vicinamibacterales bacterium]|nr:3D domain-containing protein [Vicinamibacterales bacterium]
MLLSHSTWRKLLATIIAVVGFVCLYEATIPDSRFAALQADSSHLAVPPEAGEQLTFAGTAYCKGTTTASGVAVRTGVAAADPTLLPVGSVVEINAPLSRYSGIYTILDTGPAVQGRHIDIYMWSCNDALVFGRRPIKVRVLRLGWNPRDSSMAGLDMLGGRRDPLSRRGLPVPARPSRPAPALQADSSVGFTR